MAKSIAITKLDMAIQFTINEEEARALDALAGYGDDAFIKVFYEHLGKAYMQNHEEGLRCFLSSIRKVTTPALAMIDKARQMLKQEKVGKNG